MKERGLRKIAADLKNLADGQRDWGGKQPDYDGIVQRIMRKARRMERAKRRRLLAL